MRINKQSLFSYLLLARIESWLIDCWSWLQTYKSVFEKVAHPSHALSEHETGLKERPSTASELLSFLSSYLTAPLYALPLAYSGGGSL